MKQPYISAPVRAYTLFENTLCRRLRVGACPVLTVKVIYPTLEPREGETGKNGVVQATERAAERFNSCYINAAEAFAEGCLNRWGPDMEADYLALPVDGRYLYARRVVTCMMAPKELSSLGDALRVEIIQTDGRGKGRDTAVRVVTEHLWQFPHGTFKRPPKFLKKL
ncbi:MAG: hypothetical protein IJW00_03035 [Clostridia bacterium]|nr:hypothetical protein [Clostridia bacterium]